MLLPNIHRYIGRLNPIHVAFILVVLGLIAFSNAIDHPFVHDDVVFIEKNPYIGDLNLKHIFLQTTIADDKAPLVNKYYRPFLELVNRVLYRVFGMNPSGFHFFNILLHIINGFLVYVLIRFLTEKKEGISLAAAILFLLHPVQNEAVACVAGISNLVFTFLCLVSFLMYLKAVHGRQKERHWGFYGGALIVFFLGLLAKEQSVVLPLLIIAYEVSFADGPIRQTIRKYWRPVAGFFVVLGSYFLLRKALFGAALTPVFDSGGEFWFRILAIPRSLLIYFGLIFFPHDIHYYRSQDILLPFFWPLVAVVAFFAVAAWGISRLSIPLRRKVLFGLAWFFISTLR